MKYFLLGFSPKHVKGIQNSLFFLDKALDIFNINPRMKQLYLRTKDVKNKVGYGVLPLCFIRE